MKVQGNLETAKKYWSLNKKDKAAFVLSQLIKDYPKVYTPLMHSNAFELLISVMLSPQTNDDTTNKVTPVLFERYPNPKALADADIEDVKQIIRIINFHKTKADRIIKASKMILDEFNHKVPSKMNDLLKIPGVGRKVANVIISDWYAFNSYIERSLMNGKKFSSEYDEIPKGSINPTGIVVDTHVTRISNALGLTKHKNADKIEVDLIKLFPMEEWRGISLRMIFHGREVFQAKKPQFKKHEVWSLVYGDR